MQIALNHITGTVHLNNTAGDVLGTFHKELVPRHDVGGVRRLVETGRKVFRPTGAAWVYRCADDDELREKAFRHYGIQDV